MRHRSLLAVLTLVATACGGASTQSDTTESAVTTPPPPIGPGTTSTTAPSTTTTSTTEPLSPLRGLALETVGRRFQEPVFAIAPLTDDRLFVVEKAGVIRVIAAGELLERPFLDITADVGSRGLEQGLLGLAFHPDYEENGRFFVYYTDLEGASRLLEYHASDDADRADPASSKLLLTVPQPASNHNGGMLQFGPDGYLYVALGDGGGAGDQFGNGQRPDTLLATILRLDVDAGDPYAVPPDNPFVGGDGANQVWAYGLRNPWRFDIDQEEGLIYIADVGQDAWEEISIVPITGGGLNYGWPITEGFECFRSDPCDTGGLVQPVLTYGHGEGCSVIGGFVYRGRDIPELEGHYFYGDWCGRWVRSFRYENGAIADQRDWTADLGEVGQILSFGVDAQGEIYVTTGEGPVYRLVARR
ncbi:MAG: PQQ-dependent sugar dehydrogenase [Acidimicrobiia bacterium]